MEMIVAALLLLLTGMTWLYWSERKKRTNGADAALGDVGRMLEWMPIPVVLTATESGKPIFINQRMYDLFQVSPETVSLDVSAYYVNPEKRLEFVRLLKRDGFVSGFEVEMCGPAKEPFSARLSAAMIEYEGQSANLVVVDDISELRKVEKALANSEQSFRNVFETTPHAMAITALSDGLVKRLNPACIKLFGVEGLLDTPLSATDYYVDPTDRDRLFEQLQARGAVNDFELQMHNVNGDVFDLLMHAAPVQYNDAPHLLTSFANITEQKKMHRQLELTRQMAETANIAKSKFLAAASHDLRQPMHAVNLFMALLLRDKLSNTQRDLVTKIDSALVALGSLLDALLDISKLDSGVVVPEKRIFSVHELLKLLTAECQPLAEEKRIYLRYEGRDGYVNSDPVLLESVLRNLIGNAIRYTRTGGVTVMVSRAADSDELEIAVRDTGIGIPEDQQQEVFREFHQLYNPERDRSKGLGLGLAIVQRTVALLKHRVELKSKLGEGSEFKVVLPAVEAPVSANHIRTPLVEPRDLTDLVVYFIDDHQEIRDGMAETLILWGCRPVIADSGEAALAQLQSGEPEPDIIVSDYRLRHERNGADAIKQLQGQMKRKVPAIIITGDLTEESLRDADKYGFTLLHKPVQVESLKQTIQRLVSRELVA